MGDRMGRRRVLAGLGGGVGLAALGSLTACASGTAPAPPPPPPGRETVYPAQTSWDPVPEMTGAKGLVQIPDVRLAVWDTGGTGEAVVFLHPNTGNGAVWGYQQGPLAKAGYRVISFSCRGYWQSETGAPDRPGTLVDDMTALLDTLGVQRFHLVALAKGGFAGFDAALSLPDRLLSCTIGSTLAGITDPEYKKATEAMLPKQWDDLPEAFQELGPSYRAAAPEAMAHWIENAERPKTPVEQAPKHTLTLEAIGAVKVPVQLLTGDCDLYMPPSRMRRLADRVPGAELGIFSESGHAPHWEQYRSFNHAVLAFLGRHRAAQG